MVQLIVVTASIISQMGFVSNHIPVTTIYSQTTCYIFDYYLSSLQICRSLCLKLNLDHMAQSTVCGHLIITPTVYFVLPRNAVTKSDAHSCPECDNAPVHQVRSMKTWCKRFKWQRALNNFGINWNARPSRSTSVPGLTHAFVAELALIPKCSSLPRKLEAVIAAKGGTTSNYINAILMVLKQDVQHGHIRYECLGVRILLATLSRKCTLFTR